MNENNGTLGGMILLALPILFAIGGYIMEPNNIDLLYLLFVCVLVVKYVYFKLRDKKSII